MIDPAKIKIAEYDYPLPEERIAKFPLADRDQSKLLFLKGKTPLEKNFSDLPALLPKHSLLVFNETKVIRARMLFRKETGALIEIFCLEPVAPTNDFQLAFQQSSPVIWKCLVGNSNRWKEGKLEMKFNHAGNGIVLQAERCGQIADAFLIRFSWEGGPLSFGEIIEKSGLVPLPPYLHREAVDEDTIRYQTVYARLNGSVAAPTAGLHFTDRLMESLKKAGFGFSWLTLHVGAGTFRPVTAHIISGHEMHQEKIVVSRKTLAQLAENIGKPIIPVGTTSMRTIESLYWLAVNIKKGNKSLAVAQWDAYDNHVALSPLEALNVLVDFLDSNKSGELHASTQLIIAPGYDFKLATGLITNFHQPKSTLLLLVSALIGNQWREVYHFALSNNFRFLSYGDSCLFLSK